MGNAMDQQLGAPIRGSAGEVFRVFLRLGLTSFGGPIAHLGYYRNELVLRRKWLDEQAYGDLVALCQFLPGPASSQVAFALGVFRGGGLAGGLTAWLAFTLPSALIIVAFAFGAAGLHGPVADGVFHGLKLVAVAVVAQAIWGMARTLTPDKQRAAIAILAIAVVVVVGGSFAQIASIVLGTLAGLWLCPGEETKVPGHLSFPVSARGGAVSLALFAVLLVVPSLTERATGSHAIAFFDAFYRSGALVFGGGHVVLPLLQTEVVNTGWVTNEAFLQGYGLAQAVPGPLFTFAAYLGSVASPVPNGLAGAAIALIAIFLPGTLLVYGMLPFWDALRSRPGAQAAMSGANAAVVGILGMALYDPVWKSAVVTPGDFALAVTGFLLLVVWRMPSWVVVALLAAAGALRAAMI
ncbi:MULTISPECIES: chromate efflux transporter [unclassified Mesorhizobium]|uniref:chromate efflux transporter n=1 Tax=unclassified Mesorhizobium TaxID=325217 RepID=UPI00112D57C7|nr:MULTISPECIES: chromate efflux transporter [unclassified Mesorhizobium]TPK62599.1 chromate efflux transporter [Mesorhizobium sp. B2-5-1]TPM59676.1 chromate efflux transporter [Mesorhizobium sp. B2-1-9]TPM85623.1 chromate efflux transporter [Mesorhizobium sp. B2-1-4]TPN10081.1 chromate efflux transporter [Mesorhizobium sp. B2-1-2]UCI16464.1 chromate efflux transporter [Mesorhizobium sp. B2-1-1]